MTWESRLIAGRTTVAPASAGDRAALARATAPCLPGFSDRRLKPAPLERHLVRLPRVAFGRQRRRADDVGISADRRAFDRGAGFSRRSSHVVMGNSTGFSRFLGSP